MVNEPRCMDISEVDDMKEMHEIWAEIGHPSYYSPEDKAIYMWDGAGHDYDIDVREIKTAFDVAHWCFHLGEKAWNNKRAVTEFIACMQSALYREFHNDGRTLFADGAVLEWPE